MSTQEFDQMDEELMGMVNDHAAPAAVADAEKIVERVNAPKTESAAEKLDPDDCLQETEDGYYRISKDWFELLKRETVSQARKDSLLAVILSLVIAAALILVLAVPALRFWLVALGVISCAVVAGIAVDRRCRR